MTFPVFASGDVLNASDMNAVGLWKIKAETSFSAASSVTADSIFTSNYTTYKVVIRYSTSTTNAPFMKFRVGGVSASTNYNYQDLYGGNTALGTTRTTSATSALIGLDTNTVTGMTIIDINGVALASNTVYSAVSSSGQTAATTTAQRFIQGNHSTATAYDGIELLVASGTMTGSYTIYGYRV